MIFWHTNFSSVLNRRAIWFYLLLIFFACLPVWSVEFYINQDGSPHLYNSYIILELLKGNQAFADVYALNPSPLPNLSGHYLLALLLVFFPAAYATKIMVTLTFAGLVAAVGWLRAQVCGQTGISLAILIGAALAFNWLWFLGFYNFIIGVIGYTFTLGLYWRWRERLNFSRSLILAVLLILVFSCHLISFGMLAGSLVLLSLFAAKNQLKQTVGWTLAALLPSVPLLVGYKILSEKGGEISPVWRSLTNPFSIFDWVMQIQTADPFQLLSRKAFPFFPETSSIFAVFSPLLWLAAAFICLLAGTLLSKKLKDLIADRAFPFFLIFAGSILFWIFAPDDFGKTHGGFLRERVLLCGLICFVPFFQTVNQKLLRYAAYCCLAFIIAFQTAGLWEYSLSADRLGREFLSGVPAIGDAESLGSIILIEDGCRYKASPLANLPTFYGIGKNTRIWDNYEIGFYLFPVVAKSAADRQLTYNFREASAFNLCDPNERPAEKFAALNSILDLNNDKIKTILVWGDDERVLPTLNKWYEDRPFFQNGRVRLFRHR